MNFRFHFHYIFANGKIELMNTSKNSVARAEEPCFETLFYAIAFDHNFRYYGDDSDSNSR